MKDLSITIIQPDIVWENSEANLDHLRKTILAYVTKTDIIILPEFFNTGFTLRAKENAQTMEEQAAQWMKNIAHEKQCAVVGSLQIKENNKYFNRLLWINKEGNFLKYDKRHLFSMGNEDTVFAKGTDKLIAPYNGWNLRPLTCYDLRFPVWSKNTFGNNAYAYDCLIYVANWPESRSAVWQSLLVARAIENQAYVIGVNRIGTDNKNTVHHGESMVVDPKGNIILKLPANQEAVKSITLSYKDLSEFRKNFCVGPDWDKFKIID